MNLGTLFLNIGGLFFGLAALAPEAIAATPPRGIVLLIADGTSLELLTAARIYKSGVASQLELEKLPRSAFVSTYSYDSMVTDSGAAATALARGFKADNRVVGSSPTLHPAPPSVLDIAKKAGWATGVLTDDSATGATPAPFIMEHDHREEEFIVARKEAEQLGKNCDLLLGGGQRFFQGNGPTAAEKKYLPDFAATRAAIEKSHAVVLDTWEKWLANPPNDLSQPILGIFAPEKLDYIADGDRKPHLEDMVGEALRLLQNSGKNWILIAEAGLPDKACHANNIKRALEEVLVLDRTVALIRQKIGPDTLFLVTTDHNNGGINIGPGLPVSAKGDDFLKVSPITKLPVLTFATGPGGVYSESGHSTYKPSPETDYSKPDAISPALLATGTAFHSGGNVWLVGEGPGSEKVHGFLDNTDIWKIIAAAIEGK